MNNEILVFSGGEAVGKYDCYECTCPGCNRKLMAHIKGVYDISNYTMRCCECKVLFHCNSIEQTSSSDNSKIVEENFILVEK